MQANSRIPIAALAVVLCWCGPALAAQRCLYVGDAFFEKGKVRTSRSLFNWLSEYHRGPSLFCVSAYDTRNKAKGNVQAIITVHRPDGSRQSAFLSGKPKPDGLGGNAFFDCVVGSFDLEAESMLQCDIRVRGYKLDDGESAKLECLMFPEASSAGLSAETEWNFFLPD